MKLSEHLRLYLEKRTGKSIGSYSPRSRVVPSVSVSGLRVKRRMTPAELDSTLNYDAAPSPRQGWVRKRIEQEHPYRYAALQREYRWLQRRLKKMGLNPEDARWLL